MDVGEGCIKCMWARGIRLGKRNYVTGGPCGGIRVALSIG